VLSARKDGARHPPSSTHVEGPGRDRNWPFFHGERWLGDLQQPAGRSSSDLVHVGGHVVHAGLAYAEGQAATVAYTLDPRRPPPTSATIWHAVPLNTPRAAPANYSRRLAGSARVLLAV
jgi:hypothetical protein